MASKRSRKNVYQGELESDPDYSTEQSFPKRSKKEVFFAEIIFHVDINYQERGAKKRATIENVIQHIAALLNSSGGVLRISEFENDEKTITSDRDKWIQTLEERLREILTQDEYKQCVHHKLAFPYYYLFVKKCKRVCTQSCKMNIPLQGSIREATYDDVLRVLNGINVCDPASESSSLEMTETDDIEFDSGCLEDTPDNLINKNHEEFYDGKQMEFGESDTVQFKLIKNKNGTLDDLLKGIENNDLERYVSAFANHRGGKVYFGIDDNGKVVGHQVSSENEKRKVKELVEKIVNRKNEHQEIIRIWREPSFVPKYGEQWTVEFVKINGASGKFVIVVEIFPFKGGMFLDCPLAWKVDESEEIVRMSFTEWKNHHKTESEDQQEICKRFESLNIQNKKVYQLKDMAKNFARKVFPAQRGLKMVPENVADRFKLEKGRINKLERKLNQSYQNDYGFVLMDKSWAVNVGIAPAPADVVCDLLVMSHNAMPRLITIARELSHAVDEYNLKIAKTLKLALVNEGGCLECFGIHAQVMQLDQIGDEMKIPPPVFNYPHAYEMTKELFNKVRESLVIVLAGFECSTFNPEVGANFLYVLTPDQYNICIREDQFLIVEAPPGTGKTVVAIERIKRLRKRGVSPDEILYICQNKSLASYVRSLRLKKSNTPELCSSYTRAAFNEIIKNPRSCVFNRIRHVVVDEAQNFRNGSGEDWFQSLVQILKWKEDLEEQCQDTSLAIFFDLLQKIRREEFGLKGFDEIKFLYKKCELRSVIRNSKKIFEKWSQFADQQELQLEIAHDYEGRDVNLIDLSSLSDEKEIFQKVEEVIWEVLNNKCYKPSDVAVLCNDGQTAHNLTEYLRNRVENLSDTSLFITNAEVFPRKGLVVDSFRRFSGLEAQVVIAVYPRAYLRYENMDKAKILLCSRAMVELYILNISER